MVTFSYRTEREKTPDIQTIQKQMAIVAWQPGPNRVVQVPNQVHTECHRAWRRRCNLLIAASSYIRWLLQHSAEQAIILGIDSSGVRRLGNNL